MSPRKRALPPETRDHRLPFTDAEKALHARAAALAALDHLAREVRAGRVDAFIVVYQTPTGEVIDSFSGDWLTVSHLIGSAVISTGARTREE